MSFFLYVLGGIIYLVLSIFYSVLKSGSFLLNQSTLTEFIAQAILASLSFFLADYLFYQRGKVESGEKVVE